MDRRRAISVRQPAAELILRAVKKAEYRCRPTKIRGRVMLYAAMKGLDWPEGWRKVGKEPGQLPVASSSAAWRSWTASGTETGIPRQPLTSSLCSADCQEHSRPALIRHEETC